MWWKNKKRNQGNLGKLAILVTATVGLVVLTAFLSKYLGTGRVLARGGGEHWREFQVTIYPNYNYLSIPVAVVNRNINFILKPNQFPVGSKAMAFKMDGSGGIEEEAELVEKEIWPRFKVKAWYTKGTIRPSKIAFQPFRAYLIQSASTEAVEITVRGQVVEEKLPKISNLAEGGSYYLGASYLTEQLIEGLDWEAYGGSGPDVSDNIIMYDPVSQTFYDSAWYCDGSECESWGEPWYRHWLRGDYSNSTGVIKPWQGFLVIRRR